MKQIDIIRTYSQKRCLIVDGEPDARTMLKRIVSDFGATDIDTAGSAAEAIDRCEKKPYDIVIADYHLGQGQNGQQLLEELRHNGLLSYTALYIVVTAESASHDVLHAIENEPDDFVQKPISRDSLRPRLDTALLKNEYLNAINEALDTKNTDRAQALAEKLASIPHRFQSDVKKILGELYLTKKATDKAEAIYNSLSDERTPLWAMLGLAQAEFQKKAFADAEKRLLLIMQEYEHCVDAYDLLARVYEATHRPNQSQQALINATKKSPRSAPRQRELGRVSADLGDENTAVHAYRAAIRHAKNSCQESADDFVNLAQGLVRLSQTQTSKAPELMEEAQQHLQLIKKRYGKHPIVTMHSHLISAEIHHKAKNEADVTEHTRQALELHSSMNYRVIANSSVTLCIECAKCFMDRGLYDEGEAILQALSDSDIDADYAIKIDKLLREPKTKEGIAYAAKRNKQGIQHYQKNQLDAALGSFEEVLRELPNHIGLNLNFIQALISKQKESELEIKELNELAACFQRIGKIEPASTYFKRFDYLMKRYEKVQHEVG